MITLKQMEALYWVGALGSFSAAADKLNIAQSTISKRIIELEDMLQTTLFDRDKRSGHLTMKGRELLGIAEEMLQLQRRLIEAAGSHQTYSGTFRFGITELIAITWLPNLVAELKATYPRLTLEPHVDTLSSLIGRLKERQLELVIGPVPQPDDLLTTIPLGSVEQSWMCSPTLYDGPRTIPIERLAEFPLLVQPVGSGLQSMISRLLRESGVQAKSVIACNGMVALARLAEAGIGITCLPRALFRHEVETGRLQILETVPPMPRLNFGVTYRRDTIDRLSSLVASIAVDVCAFGDGAGEGARVLPQPIAPRLSVGPA